MSLNLDLVLVFKPNFVTEMAINWARVDVAQVEKATLN